jgi:D-psicose/D-tagatose/L-ribulose 3-epimerase
MKYGLCCKEDGWALAGRIGFDYVEMPLSWIAQLDDEAFSRLTEEAKGNVPVLRCNLMFPKTMDLYTVSDGELDDYLEKGFSRMDALGSALVVLGSGKSRMVPSGMEYGRAVKRLCAVTRRSSDAALRHKVTIALEPLNRGESNMLNSVTEASLFASLVDRPNVQVLADMFHMTKENEDWGHINLVGHLAHTHIAVRGTRGYPLEKDEDVAAFFSSLASISYDGTMSIEGKTTDMGNDGAKALRFLRSLHG